MALLGMPFFAILLMVPLVDQPGDPITILINYGGLVGAFALVILGRLRTPQEVAVLTKQVETLTKSNEDKDDTIAMLTNTLQAFATSVSQTLTPALRGTADVVEAIPNQQVPLEPLLRQSLAEIAALRARLDAGEAKGSP